MYYTYILKSEKDGKYYIGSTQNIEAGLASHNSAKQRSTRSRIPFKLAYTETFSTKQDALLREKILKSYKGGEAFKKLLGGV